MHHGFEVHNALSMTLHGPPVIVDFSPGPTECSQGVTLTKFTDPEPNPTIRKTPYLQEKPEAPLNILFYTLVCCCSKTNRTAIYFKAIKGPDPNFFKPRIRIRPKYPAYSPDTI